MKEKTPPTKKWHSKLGKFIPIEEIVTIETEAPERLKNRMEKISKVLKSDKPLIRNRTYKANAAYKNKKSTAGRKPISLDEKKIHLTIYPRQKDVDLIGTSSEARAIMIVLFNEYVNSLIK